MQGDVSELSERNRYCIVSLSVSPAKYALAYLPVLLALVIELSLSDFLYTYFIYFLHLLLSAC